MIGKYQCASFPFFLVKDVFTHLLGTEFGIILVLAKNNTSTVLRKVMTSFANSYDEQCID